MRRKKVLNCLRAGVWCSVVMKWKTWHGTRHEMRFSNWSVRYNIGTKTYRWFICVCMLQRKECDFFCSTEILLSRQQNISFFISFINFSDSIFNTRKELRSWKKQWASKDSCSDDEPFCLFFYWKTFTIKIFERNDLNCKYNREMSIWLFVLVLPLNFAFLITLIIVFVNFYGVYNFFLG